MYQRIKFPLLLLVATVIKAIKLPNRRISSVNLARSSVQPLYRFKMRG